MHGDRELTAKCVRIADRLQAEIIHTARYGLIHEFGGTIHVPEIVPTKAKSLHWIGKGGEEVFAMHAQAHDVRMPERSFMRSSFVEFRDRIEDQIRAAVRKASEA